MRMTSNQSSPKFPPGFTPNNDNDDTGDKKSVNDFEEEKLNEDDRDSNNSNLKENVDTIDGVWKEQPNDVKQEFLSHFQDRFAKPSERRAM
ncbi:hypothetical protein Tco_0520965 [Tanacetum coccineum]